MALSASVHRAPTMLLTLSLSLSVLFLGASAAPSGQDSPSASSSSPSSSPSLSTAAESGDDHDVLYDQRQNGTENVRIHMNDVTVVVAPSDGLLQLLSAGAGGTSELFGPGQSSNSHNLQLPTSEFSTNIASAEGKPGFDCDALGKCRHAQQPAPNKKNRFRLSNILMPLFNRVQHNNNN